MKCNYLIKSVLTLLLIFPLALSAASRDQAQALAEKAVDYIEANGIDKSKTEMENPNGEFIDGELYVFVQKFDGTLMIHGTNPKLVGKTLMGMKDPNGVYFVKEMIKAGKTKGSGWVKYVWKNPKTGKLAPKVSYVKKIPSLDAVAGVGIYE